MFEIHSSILLKSARIVVADSATENQPVDILISDGKIDRIASEINQNAAKIVDLDGAFVSPGWCDIGAYCGEPGDEVHETIDSLSTAARSGGYTHVGLFSNQHRPYDNRHIISDIISRSDKLHIHPIGAMTKNLEGKELSEILDLSSIGCRLFSDGHHSNFDNALLCKAFEYGKQSGACVMTIPGADRRLKPGQVNESEISAQMGLPGIPGFEEVANLSSQLSLASYVGSPIFVHLVSHRETLDLIEFRREQGMHVLSSVSGMHIMHTDKNVSEFDENFKVLPPLRSEDDRQAIIAGLKSGLIDMVVSNHQPLSTEVKAREFGESPFGAIGLETTFYNINSAIDNIDPIDIQEWLCDNPRRALGLSRPYIQVDAAADLTCFHIDGETTWQISQSKSQSRNSPYEKKTFKGKVIGTVLNNQLYLNS